MAINMTDCMEHFRAFNIDPTTDFHSLSSDQVNSLLVLAKQQGYKKFNDGNGSLGRYFFYAVQRLYTHYQAGEHAYNHCGTHIALHAEHPTRTRAAWAAGYKAAQQEWRSAHPKDFAYGQEWHESKRRMLAYQETLRVNTNRINPKKGKPA